MRRLQPTNEPSTESESRRRYFETKNVISDSNNINCVQLYVTESLILNVL